MREIAADMLSLAHTGLAGRRRLNAAGDDETGFLQPLHRIVKTGLTPAEVLLERYDSEWNDSLDPLFIEQAYY